ncbi:MAG: carbamoyltransferase HypF [Planctomycetota bacterium]
MRTEEPLGNDTAGLDCIHGSTEAAPASGIVRQRLKVYGRVQGVGFRPHVWRLASELRLGGLVANSANGVLVEAEGPAGDLEQFAQHLKRKSPPLAMITGLSVRDIPLQGDRDFRIVPSTRGENQNAEVTPDAATCQDCLAELLEPQNRRYRYPFINCTNCGPRYSIIQTVPYDRPGTTMLPFRMCPACQAEYDDPADRRFHAQPNACAACGPRVWLIDADGQETAQDAIRVAAGLLWGGAIVAVKGIGGFHLVCRADSDSTVARLRRRKAREAKPLALMVPSLQIARELAEIDEVAAEELTSVSRPIVLLPKRPPAGLSEHVAPGTPCLGIMLPYAPVHHLLFAEGLGPLVMTSANPSDEPLCSGNDEARRRLVGIADAFLLHDRDIERRVDDSVVRVFGGNDSARALPFRVIPVRRARGYAPAPVALSEQAPLSILAVGGQLKSAVCLAADNHAILSEHLGELSNPAAYRNFVHTIERFKDLFRIEPEVVAHDLHPAYAATRYAQSLGLRCERVQHHHAHIVSCMADNGLSGRVVGVACDGTGYGPDGAIWGCEVLACDEVGFQRTAHLHYFPLLGGDAAARQTWRPALGLLHEAYGPDLGEAAFFALRRVDPEAVRFARRQLGVARQVPQTSSLGRLFDAVTFLLGICDDNRYEAEAAAKLEALALGSLAAEPLAYGLIEPRAVGEAPITLDPRPLIRELVAGIESGRAVPELAYAFHETVAAMLAEAAHRAAERTGLNRIILSGGCFANRLLTERIVARLGVAGCDVFTHQRVPTTDGGIALGQAVIAAARARRRMECA